MEFVLLDLESKEISYLWSYLELHPLNEGIDEPSVALHEGESWNYMGTFINKDKVIHTLRHLNHPRYNRIETISVRASSGFTQDQIVKTFKV